jgi:ubiquitin C-terminal hydrolase
VCLSALATHVCNDFRRRYHLAFSLNYPEQFPDVHCIVLGACKDKLPIAWQAKTSAFSVFSSTYLEDISKLKEIVDSVYPQKASVQVNELGDSDDNSTVSFGSPNVFDAARKVLPVFGLPNLGNTCFMNATLQCILHTTELSHLFLGRDFDGSSLQPQDIKDQIIIRKNRRFARCFKKLVNHSTPDEVAPILRKLMQLTGKTQAERDKGFKPGSIGDANEWFYSVVERICPSMFRLPIVSQLTCTHCTRDVNAEDRKLCYYSRNGESESVMMPFPSTRHGVAATLADFLDTYLSTEMLDSDHICPTCQERGVTEKQLFIDNLPNFFYISVKRFEYSTPSGAKRVDRYAEVPVEYDFGTHYFHQQPDIFRLYAAVCHIPGGFGHYTAYCQLTPNEAWCFCNDGSVTPCSESEVLLNIKRNGYFFFFRRRASTEHGLSLLHQGQTSAVSASPTLTKQTADVFLVKSGWRRCFALENGHSTPSLEHDDFRVLHVERDGDCLFNCFIAILVERRLVDFASHEDPKQNAECIKENVATMRDIIVKGFNENENKLKCTMVNSAGERIEGVPFSCENLSAICSGKGGRGACGGANEIVCFALLYGLTVTVFAPESQTGHYTINPCDKGRESGNEMLLNMLGWHNEEQNEDTSHWQRVKHVASSVMDSATLATKTAGDNLNRSDENALQDKANDAMKRIFALTKKDFLRGMEFPRGNRKPLGDFEVGITCLENLRCVVNQLHQHQRCSEVPESSKVYKRAAEACYFLQSIADNFNSTARKNQFLTQCESVGQQMDTFVKQYESSIQLKIAAAAAAAAYVPDASVAKKFSSLPSLPSLPCPQRKPASAARFAHAFPYSFRGLGLNPFDVSFIPDVNPTLSSSLFNEFDRVREQYPYVQYPDDHYQRNDTRACLHNRTAPTINHNIFMTVDTVDWFFGSLATLFPDIMVLSPYLINWNHGFPGYKFDDAWHRSFLQNVKDRRPRFVMHPFCLPEYLDKPKDGEKNKDSHFVLSFIEFDWSRHSVSSKISVLDPYSNRCFTDPVLKLYQKKNYFSSFNPVFETAKIQPIQIGKKNLNCAVYIMALALNAVFGTLSSMGNRLNPTPNSNDTCDVGLELRKYVAWDCTQFPSLLDTCLLMSPKFSPISRRSEAVRASAWWVQTPYHNIADSLAIKYGNIFIPVKFTGKRFREMTDRVMISARANWPSSWFFTNKTLLVKVICIGLIGHRLASDHQAAKRAAHAFQEASASPFVCNQKGWFCETFGLICVGLVCPCAFVCIVRTLGTNSPGNHDGRSFHDLSSLQISSHLGRGPLRVMHGDSHGENEVLVASEVQRGNEVLAASEVQLIDFDRTYLITGECPPPFFFKWYAISIAELPRNPFHIRALMRIIKRSGLGATHEYFSAFYQADTFLDQNFNADLFEQSPITCWNYDAFLHLFQLIFDACLEPKLITDSKIQCKLKNDITILAFDSPNPGFITVSCAVEPLQEVLLASEFDTNSFFQTWVTINSEHTPVLQPRPIPPHLEKPADTCVGFWHLMGLLQQKGNCSDRTPQLQISHDKQFISCDIRPLCCRDTVVPCKIFFEVTATGSIKICSAEFDGQEHRAFLEKNFRDRQTLFNLENEDVASRFFNFALSMEPIYGSTSDSDNNSPSTDPPPPPHPAPLVSSIKPPESTPVHLQNHKTPVPSDTNLIYLVKAIEEHGNANVLESIKVSMKRRFGDAGCLDKVKVSKKPNPMNVLREEHFGCKIELVTDDSTRNCCIKFVESQTLLSLDTETTVPRYDDQEISLIQIGTSTNVFIIQVALQTKVFLSSLGVALSGKTLLCWGNDEDALRKIVEISGSRFEDVQKKYSSSSQKKGLNTAIQDLLGGKYVLNKNWRLSGWDNDPLTKGQLRYAALDVVCCHALYTARKFGRDSVCYTNDNHITFYAYNSITQSKVKHGFSFAPDFLGHYNNGSVSRGFRFSQSPPILQGFEAVVNASHGLISFSVQQFMQLLNEFKLCCALCSSCWVRKEWRVVSTSGNTSFCYTTGTERSEFHSVVHRVSENFDEQNAYCCVSMLASFLQLQPSKENLQCLTRSVCSDIHYGYIHETLAHLSPCSNADASEVIDKSTEVNACERFSDSDDFFGHYQGNTAIRGFRLESSSEYPQGFKAASCACDAVQNCIVAFTKLLIEKRFCCSNCTTAFSKRVQCSSHFIPAALKRGPGQTVRSFGLKKRNKITSHEVAYDDQNSLEVNDAIFCLTMLGVFFNLPLQVDDKLLYSVHQDVHDGYISKSLAYLVPAE